MIRALVVDDEPLARERIRTLLEALPGFQVAGECGDALQALQALDGDPVDVLLLDIQMPGMDGLELAGALAREGRLPWVVFITAYDRHAMEAFRLHALDYLLKPIDPDRFREAMDRVRLLAEGRERLDLDRRIRSLLEDHERRRGTPLHLVVQERDRYRLVPVRDIHCLEATGNYVCLHLASGTHFLRGTLGAVEARLDGTRFLRTHRSWIVNLDHVQEAQPTTKGNWVLLTRGGHKVPLSHPHREALRRVLDP